MLKLGVLASGRGSNLQAIIDNIRAGKIQAVIKVVVSDCKDAYALSRAKKYNIDNYYLNPENYINKREFEEAIIDIFTKYSVELVIMAGFMRILSNFFIKNYQLRIMNIHPSLLPAFPGLDAQRQALEYGVKISGCTVHFADVGMDSGPIIIQTAVPVEEDDHIETLCKRILEKEHEIYPLAIQLYSEGRLKVNGRTVKIVGKNIKKEQ